MDHLVYCDGKAKVLEKILNGTKTMIIRGNVSRKLPYGRVFKGETLYLIENRGDGLIKGRAIVKSVFNSERLEDAELKEVVNKNMEKLNLTEDQVTRILGKRFLCLVEIENAEEIEVSLKHNHQRNMDDWIIVENISSLIEETSNI
ncbi:hypothetical protein NNC19_04180 [Clostridium sp. SHJSY1]|uniref:hypothetical protein n=1 Tax=Clostridium sp. SHJSY1 TaxID=2942483 RepID=UPI002876DA3E|nr:hypothetical protein [Clostridium sp. SHJSY1]MDS0524866.1 hypothetical protein [Clostridium sp. SHJSY1]